MQNSLETKPPKDEPLVVQPKDAQLTPTKKVIPRPKRPNRKDHRQVEDEERRQLLELQKKAFNHVVSSSKVVLLPVLVIIFLQGFGLWGFRLPKELLYILIVATVSKLAESFYVVLRFLFDPNKKRQKR